MKLRGVLVSCALVVACKSDPGASKLAERVPIVSTGEQLLPEHEEAPPVLILMKADGALAVADAPRGPDAWHVLSTKAPKTSGQPIDLRTLGPLVREASELGTRIERNAKTAGKLTDEDLAALAGDDDDLPLLDDPPPPEPDDEDLDDLDDDSGGTGTAMALDEGKMGTKDADRAAGQYVMRRNSADPQLARQQAIDQARQAGILADLDDVNAGGFGPGDVDPDGHAANPDATLPRRVTDITGARAADGDRAAHALIVAAPETKAHAVLDVMTTVGATFIAVSHQQKLRALRMGFGLTRSRGFAASPSDYWVEVRVGADTIAVEAVPGKPIELPAKWPLDVAALGRAYGEAAASIGDRKDVDLLVGPELDLQRLVDLIVALDAAGAEIVSLGRLPSSDELAKRGKPIVRARIGQPQSVGDLDKAIIRRYVKRNLPAITQCYEKALLTAPDLQGTVQTQFFIAPDGSVATASGTGVNAEVAGCVADVIKGIEFPKPRGGGGVQVNYPFTFRPR